MNWQLVRSKLVGSVSEINWSLEQFWKFLLGEVWPLKGRKYLEERFELFKNIDLDKRNGRSIHLIYFLLVISAILSIVQCFHNEPAFVLLTFDFLGYNKLSASIKFSKALMNIAVFAFYQGNYFNISKVQTLVSYTRILTHNDRSCVFDSNFDFWKLIQGTLMFYQVFVVAFELGMLFFYLQLGVALSAHPFDQLYLWPLAYLSMSIGFFLHSVTCLLICVGGWAASATILMFKVLFEKLSFQSRRYLQHPIDRFTPLRLLRYRWHNAKLMKGQFELSHVFGNLLLTFLWTNIPMNVSIIALLALNKIPNAIIFYIGMITCLGQATVIIFYHLIGAMLTHRIHRPYKTIHSQFVKYRRSTLYSHVRIATNIQTFLVKKRYGATYKQLGMDFGLVSMSTFLKFVFIYFEALLFGYSMYLELK